MDTVVLTSARGLRRLYQLFNKFIKIPKKNYTESNFCV
jgi:hypothetical protein